MQNLMHAHYISAMLSSASTKALKVSHAMSQVQERIWSEKFNRIEVYLLKLEGDNRLPDKLSRNSKQNH